MKSAQQIPVAVAASSSGKTDVITVLVADDHPVVREGVANMVRQQPDLRVVAEAADGAEALAAWERHRPDVTLLDLRMPVLDAVAVIGRIRAIQARARVIILTTYDNEEDLFRIMQAGARAYLLKDIPRIELLDSIRKVARGEICLSPELALKLASRIAVPDLTPREREVIQLAAHGKANKEIAAVLGIGEGTIKAHLKAIFEKLDAISRTEAVTIAHRRGLVRL